MRKGKKFLTLEKKRVPVRRKNRHREEKTEVGKGERGMVKKVLDGRRHFACLLVGFGQSLAGSDHHVEATFSGRIWPVFGGVRPRR